MYTGYISVNRLRIWSIESVLYGAEIASEWISLRLWWIKEKWNKKNSTSKSETQDINCIIMTTATFKHCLILLKYVDRNWISQTRISMAWKLLYFTYVDHWFCSWDKKQKISLLMAFSTFIYAVFLISHEYSFSAVIHIAWFFRHQKIKATNLISLLLPECFHFPKTKWEWARIRWEIKAKQWFFNRYRS